MLIWKCIFFEVVNKNSEKNCHSLLFDHTAICKQGIAWNENFGMKYKRCQSRMKYFKNGIADNFQYFPTNSILDFNHDMYRKIHTDSDKSDSRRSAQHLFHYLSTNCVTSVACIASTLYLLRHSKYTAICSIDAVADGFDRFRLVFSFQTDNLPSCFFFLPLSRKFLRLLFHPK